MRLFKLGLKEQCWAAVGGEQMLTHTERMNKILAVLLSCQWGQPALCAEPESPGPQGSGTQVRRRAWNTSLDDAKWGSGRQTLVEEQAQRQRQAGLCDVDVEKSDVSKGILS